MRSLIESLLDIDDQLKKLDTDTLILNLLRTERPFIPIDMLYQSLVKHAQLWKIPTFVKRVGSKDAAVYLDDYIKKHIHIAVYDYSKDWEYVFHSTEKFPLLHTDERFKPIMNSGRVYGTAISYVTGQAASLVYSYNAPDGIKSTIEGLKPYLKLDPDKIDSDKILGINYANPRRSDNSCFVYFTKDDCENDKQLEINKILIKLT